MMTLSTLASVALSGSCHTDASGLWSGSVVFIESRYGGTWSAGCSVFYAVEMMSSWLAVWCLVFVDRVE